MGVALHLRLRNDVPSANCQDHHKHDVTPWDPSLLFLLVTTSGARWYSPWTISNTCLRLTDQVAWWCNDTMIRTGLRTV
jgi:hypothetical protein